MKKFYPSSSAFMIGDTVMTKYDGGCLRSILAKANGVRTGELHPTYKRIGAVHEEKYHKELLADENYAKVLREIPIRKSIADTVDYSGRLDFLTMSAKDDTEVVHECKGTASKNARRDYRKGIYNVTYLAQTVSYMIDRRTTRGKMVCGYYEQNDLGDLLEQERHVFRVTITETGRIDVNGEPSGYNVADVLAHRHAAAQHIERNEVGPRPDKWNQQWGGPCTRCVFNQACEKYDNTQERNTETFLRDAEICVQTAPKQPDPVINKVKVKKLKAEKKPKGSKKNGREEKD